MIVLMCYILPSDFPSLASGVPYFQCDSDLRAFSPEGMHLVVCVHGLDGKLYDYIILIEFSVFC